MPFISFTTSTRCDPWKTTSGCCERMQRRYSGGGHDNQCYEDLDATGEGSRDRVPPLEWAFDRLPSDVIVWFLWITLQMTRMLTLDVAAGQTVPFWVYLSTSFYGISYRPDMVIISIYPKWFRARILYLSVLHQSEFPLANRFLSSNEAFVQDGWEIVEKLYVLFRLYKSSGD